MDTSYEVTSVEKTTVFDATSLKKNSSEFFDRSNHGVVRLEKYSSEFFELSNPGEMRHEKNPRDSSK